MKTSQLFLILIELIASLIIIIYAEAIALVDPVVLGIALLITEFGIFIGFVSLTDLCRSDITTDDINVYLSQIHDLIMGINIATDRLLREIKYNTDHPPWIHVLPVAAFLHLRQWSVEEKIQILNSLGAESAEYCPQCGAKCRVNPAPSSNKLFVWDSCEDYSIKKIIIYAPSVEKARKIALKQLDSGIFTTSGLSSEPTMYEGETFGYVDIRD